MKKLNKKSLALLIAAALLLTITVSSTVAYLVDSTGSLVNTFKPAEVNTSIVETFTDNVKSVIKIYNDKTEKAIPVYVRVAVVGNWMLDGKIVDSWSLDNSFIDTTYWAIGSDGYYYYKDVLAVDATTENLLEKQIEQGNRADGAKLQVIVINQAIQADGMGVSNAQAAFAKAAAGN